MPLPTLFDLCQPRQDVLDGAITRSDFAADLAQVEECIAPDLLPGGPVRLAAFDGENADPFNGRPLSDGLRAYTPWGKLAYALAGRQGYALVQRSDVEGGAPGADTLKELFGGEPTLILLDELSVYLRPGWPLRCAR